MAGKIFINYRRGDDAGHTGRLFDRLQDDFEPGQLFLDVDNITPGADFIRELSERVAECDVFLAVIGKHWIDARNEKGQRRLDDPDDFVRIEIASALRQNKWVIPILVGQAQMPRADELPEDIRALVRRNAVRLTHERFHADTKGLIRGVQRALETTQSSGSIAETRASPIKIDHAGISKEQLRDARPRLHLVGPLGIAVVGISAIIVIGLVYWQRIGPIVIAQNSPPRVAEASAPSSQSASPSPAAAPVGKPQPSLKVFAPLSSEQERGLGANGTFKECDSCPEMKVVPAGQFTMGSDTQDIDNGLARANERPQHKVAIAQPFAIGRFEVTKDEFEAFVAASGYKAGDRCFTFENGVAQERADRSFRNPGFAQTGKHPAVCVSFTDARAYVAWLSSATGKTYRLPSESEWEYAARAGSASRYGFGNDPAELCKYANGADQTAKLAELPDNYGYMTCTDGYAYTAPVGSFQANSWSLFDFLGNVWEATDDCFAEDYSGSPTDGSALQTTNCDGRTVRGGSWFSNELLLRPAVRAKAAPLARHDDLGFRVARTLAR